MQKAEYEAQATSQQDMIGRLHTDRRALEAAEVQLAKDSSTIATLIQQRSGRTGVIRRGNGRMVYPCAGEITSNFGFRMHPILGYMKFHAGMDFGADYGSAIFAAESGTVIFAGWYGGYGNAVILDHGGSITTLYGHTSELYVEEGQTVQRGQPIAAVGSTGLSTGPHLHFEVRENGEPVDPIAYL
jgi:murein DD-endopeptidase MepM/ murein hydrolase activator NlpD